MSVRGRHERGRDATASWRPPTRRKKIRYRGCRGVGAEERARAGALWISGRGAHHRVARAVARLRAESVRHLFCDGRGDVHVRPVLAVYGHPHRRERERHEERRGDGRAARATRSTADGDVAGVTHRQGRYERRVSARRASGQEAWGFAAVVAEERFASQLSSLLSGGSVPVQMIGARGQLLPNRILKKKISFVVMCAFREPPA